MRRVVAILLVMVGCRAQQVEVVRLPMSDDPQSCTCDTASCFTKGHAHICGYCAHVCGPDACLACIIMTHKQDVDGESEKQEQGVPDETDRAALENAIGGEVATICPDQSPPASQLQEPPPR